LQAKIIAWGGSQSAKKKHVDRNNSAGGPRGGGQAGSTHSGKELLGTKLKLLIIHPVSKGGEKKKT